MKMAGGLRYLGAPRRSWIIWGFILLMCIETLTANMVTLPTSDPSSSTPDRTPTISSTMCPLCSSSDSSSSSPSDSSPQSSDLSSDSSPRSSDSSPQSSDLSSDSSPRSSDSSQQSSDSSPHSSDSSSDSTSDSSPGPSDSSPQPSDSSSSLSDLSSDSSPRSSDPSQQSSDSSPHSSDSSPHSSDSSSDSTSDSSPGPSDSSPQPSDSSSSLSDSSSDSSPKSSDSSSDSSPDSSDSSPHSSSAWSSDSSPGISDSSPQSSDLSSDSSPRSSDPSQQSSDSSPHSSDSSPHSSDSSSDSTSDSSPGPSDSSPQPSDSSSSLSDSSSDSSPKSSDSSSDSPPDSSDSSSDSSSAWSSDSSPGTSDSSPDSPDSSSPSSDSSPDSSDSLDSSLRSSRSSTQSSNSSPHSSHSFGSSSSEQHYFDFEYACSWATYIVAVEPVEIAGSGGEDSLIGPPDTYPCYTNSPTSVPSFSYIIFDIPEYMHLRRVVIYIQRGITALEYIMLYDEDSSGFEILWETNESIVTGCSAGIVSAELDYHEFSTMTISVTFDGDRTNDGIEVDAIQVYGSLSATSSLRIVEGASLTQGRVEAFDHDEGYWGTICRGGDLTNTTGEFLADQLGQSGFERFGAVGEFPESMYAPALYNPQCSYSSTGDVHCSQQSWNCGITDVGIVFKDSSLAPCSSASDVEESEIDCTCHKTKSFDPSSCSLHSQICSPSFISVSGDIDAHLYIRPTVGQEETTSEAFTSPITQGETTVEETTLGDVTVEETTFPKMTHEETIVEETTLGDVTIGETTTPEVTPEGTAFEEATIEGTTISETTVSVLTVEETTFPEVTPGGTTLEGTIIGETTLGVLTVEETTFPEVTLEGTTFEETTIGESTLGVLTVEETTLPEVTPGRTTIKEATVHGNTVSETTLGVLNVGETTLPEAETMTFINTASVGNTPSVPSDELTVVSGTEATVYYTELQTPEGSGDYLQEDGAFPLPLGNEDEIEGDLHWASTKHCASLGCQTNHQYSGRGELVDLRNASISCSTERWNSNCTWAFAQKLIADPLDFNYVMDNDFLDDYPGFIGWRGRANDTKQPHISINFHKTVTVQGLVVLGGQNSSALVTSLKLAYKDTRDLPWKYFQEDGSTEPKVFGLDYTTSGHAMLMFDRWHEARSLILLPQTWNGEVWMRFFVLGATYGGGLVPLGMESGVISDAQISASSFLSDNHAPWAGRLNGSSAWCADVGDSKPWITVDLLTRAHVDKIVIQGLVNESLAYPAASGSYPIGIQIVGSVKNYFTHINVQEGESANSASDVQEYYTRWDTVARYLKIKIQSSSNAYSCLRFEIYGYMNFEQWPDFNEYEVDEHIEYGTVNDVPLESSLYANPPIPKYKGDHFLFLNGAEIAHEFCPGQNPQWDTSASTTSSTWPEQTEQATTGAIFTEIFSVEMWSPATDTVTSPFPSSSPPHWLCPDIAPDTTFTSTVIFTEALTIREGRLSFSYFLRGDDRTRLAVYMRVLDLEESSYESSWTYSEELIAEAQGTPEGSPGEWIEDYIDHEFSENYQLVLSITIVADNYSLVAIDPKGFRLVSDSFTDEKEVEVGMRNRNVLDYQISSSSNFGPNKKARHARLVVGTGWCPSGIDMEPWIQVDLTNKRRLDGIVVQGRSSSSDWVTKYYIRVSDDGNTWRYYDNLNYPTIFEGGWSDSSVVLQSLSKPMDCWFVRIYPVANNTYPCLRFDLTGYKRNNDALTTDNPTTNSSQTTSQAISTTPNAATSNSFIHSTSESTLAQSERPSGNNTSTLIPNATLGYNTATIQSTIVGNNSTTILRATTNAGSLMTTNKSSSSAESTTPSSKSKPGGSGGSNQSEVSSPMTTNTEEMFTETPGKMFTESPDEVKKQIVRATNVDEVSGAVTNPNNTVTFEQASAALNVVENLTQHSSGPLSVSDIDTIKGILSAVSSKAASTKETAQNFLDVVGSILVPNDTSTDPDTRQQISTENSTSLKSHASNIMELVESFATDAAESLLSTSKKNVFIKNDEIALQLTKISPEDTVNTTDPVSVSVNSSTNELHFPSSVFKGKNVTISAVVFNNLHLTSSSQLSGLHGNATPTSVGSKIMSIQVNAADGSSIKFSADNPVELVLELNEDANTTNTQSLCVFWEFIENEEYGGVWSTVGCHRNHTSGSQITCHCDHLTNFAILLQVNPNPTVLSLAHRVTLDMLTYVGLALSVSSLVCTLTTFVMLKLMKSQRTMIHTNLCIALLSAQLLYLIGIERTDPSWLCTTIAVLLHYLFTSTFSWMLMEGVYILMQSRSAYGKGGKTWMYMLAGWGSPAVIITVSLGIRLDGYGTNDYCWLSVEKGFMWAFATPVLTVLAMNTIVLIMVIRVFMALKANLDKTEAERLRAGVRAVLLLQPLLGFTWVFGLLAAYDSTLFFAYMFVILNSLQGVFIFIVNCLMNEEVKKAFRTKYHRYGGKRRSTQTTQISTTETSVAFKTSRAFMDRSQASTKSNKRSSVVDGLALKLNKSSTKVQPISDDKANTKL